MSWCHGTEACSRPRRRRRGTRWRDRNWGLFVAGRRRYMSFLWHSTMAQIVRSQQSQSRGSSGSIGSLVHLKLHSPAAATSYSHHSAAGRSEQWSCHRRRRHSRKGNTVTAEQRKAASTSSWRRGMWIRRVSSRSKGAAVLDVNELATGGGSWVGQLPIRARRGYAMQRTRLTGRVLKLGEPDGDSVTRR